MCRETYRGFKSLILRQNLGNPPEVTTNENSRTESNDSLTVPDVPISNGYLTKIIAERARKERPDFIAPTTTNDVQKASVGKPMENVIHSAPVIQGEVQAPHSTKVINLDGGGSDGYQEIYNYLKLHLRMRRRIIDFFFQDND